MEGEVDESEIVLGYHKPPFNSQSHLHLHLLYPRSGLSWWNRNFRFLPGTPWFITQSDLILQLQKEN